MLDLVRSPVKAFFLLTLLVAITTEASPPVASHSGVTDTEVVIGIVNQQTSTIAPSGLGLTAGYRAAFQQVNVAGGINNRKIRLIVYDDAYEPAKTVEETKRAIHGDHVFALTGYNATAPIKAVFPMLSTGSVPFLFPRTGDRFVREKSFKAVFNFRGTFDDELDVLVKQIGEKKLKRISFLYQPDALGDAIRSSTVTALKAAKIFDSSKNASPFASEAVVPRNSSDPKEFAAAFQKLKAGRPDVVIIGCSSKTAAELIKLSIANGETWSWYGTNNTNAIVEMLGTAEPDLVFSQVVPPFESKSAFNNEYRSAMTATGADKDINFISYEGYINGRIILEAIRRAGKDLNQDSFTKALEAEPFRFGEMQVDWDAGSHNSRGKIFLTHLKEKKLVGF